MIDTNRRSPPVCQMNRSLGRSDEEDEVEKDSSKQSLRQSDGEHAVTQTPVTSCSVDTKHIGGT